MMRQDPYSIKTIQMSIQGNAAPNSNGALTQKNRDGSILANKKASMHTSFSPIINTVGARKLPL